MAASDTHHESAELLQMMYALVDDIGQFLEWSQLAGAEALPADGRLPHDVREAIRTAPAAPARRRPPERLPDVSKKKSAEREAAATPPAQGAAGPAGAPSLGNWEAFLGAGASAQGHGPGDATSRVVFEGRATAVYGYGAADVPLMIIGESVEAQDGGVLGPFDGSAGQMLARMLANVLSLERTEVYVANVVARSASGQGRSTADERAQCRAAVRQRIEAVRPRVVLVLGDTACRTALSDSAAVGRLRGRWHTVRVPGGTVRAMVSFHPSHLLSHAGEKRSAFDDLKMVRSALAAAP